MNDVKANVLIHSDRSTVIQQKVGLAGDSPNVATDSFGSSVEIRDGVIDESWDWASVQRHLRQRDGTPADGMEVLSKKRHQKPSYVHLNIGERQHAEDEEHSQSHGPNGPATRETWLGIVWRWWNERAINARLMAYDEEERDEFVGLRKGRVEAIFEDEKAKEMLSRAMLCSKTQELLHRDDYSLARLLHRKYGERMTEWVVFYANQIEPHKGKKGREKKLLAKNSEELGRLLSADVNEQLLAKANNDPLTCWFRQRTDVSGRMLARIQNLASAIAKRVAWSFLIEPGRPRTDLSKFFAEFDVLESFFDKVELSPAEGAQKAFDANSLLKVRNRRLTCGDWSRVQLTVPAEFVREGVTHEEFVATKRHLQIFGDFDCPQIATRVEFGHGDFINASYVRGGPLLNTFILAQAPLPQTIPDFWRMVWQERSEWIFMLCEATTDSLTEGSVVVGSAAKSHCPFFWPRFEGEIRRFGHLRVKNVAVDAATDPLFTIVHLELWQSTDEPQIADNDDGTSSPSATASAAAAHRRHSSKAFRLQLWHYDWRNYTDFHWPFRVLIRARHSKHPTVLMCADGCGRSGTLALIEVFLMQLLRGAVSFEHPMLTAAVFLRLQRRHAVSTHIQYLFAYRAVLHWLQPFIISWYHRAVLGFTSHFSGFCGKYDEIARAYTHKKNLLI